MPVVVDAPPQTLTLESDEAARLVLELGPEQWARVSSAHVKDRSPLDCRIYYLHNLAPQRPWALEESARLRELVEKHKEHRVSALPCSHSCNSSPHGTKQARQSFVLCDNPFSGRTPSSSSHPPVPPTCLTCCNSGT